MKKWHKRIVNSKTKSNKSMSNLLGLLVLAISVWGFSAGSTQDSHATDYACSTYYVHNGDNPDWTVSKEKDLQIVFTWNIFDPKQCISKIDKYVTNPEICVLCVHGFTINYTFPQIKLPQSWKLIRSGDYVVVTASVEVPIDWLEASPNDGTNSNQLMEDVFSGLVSLQGSDDKFLGNVQGSISKPTLWGIWFSKNQGINTSDCNFPSADSIYESPKNPIEPKIEYKVLSYGSKPIIQIDIKESRNCIFLVHSGPLESVTDSTSQAKYFAESPFWKRPAIKFFSSILTSPDKLIQVGSGNFASNEKSKFYPMSNYPWATITSQPKNIMHSDSISGSDNSLTIKSTLELSSNFQSTDSVGIFIGYYYWYSGGASSLSGGWRITWTSSSTFTATYSPSSYSSPLRLMQYQTRFISIPADALLLSPADKAAADKAAFIKAANEKAAADKLIAEKTFADWLAQQKVAEVKRKTTIICLKGGVIKKVTAIKPSCPKGYKKKK